MTDQTPLPPNAVHPLTRAEWRAWLEQNHGRDEGVWLVTYKRTTGKPRVEYEESVEDALCFGWIDGQAKTLDAQRTLQWFAPPRRAQAGRSRTKNASSD